MVTSDSSLRLRRDTSAINAGKNIEDEEGREHHAADHDDRQRLLHLRADTRRQGGGHEANSSDHAGHQYGPHLKLARAQHRADAVHAAVDEPIVLADDQDAVHDGDPKQRDKADRGGHAERKPGDEQRQDPADNRHGDDGERQQRVGKG